MNNKILCRICNSQSKLIYKNHPSYIKNMYYNIHYCEYCNTSFVEPLENDSDIYNKIYCDAQNIDGYSRYYDYSRIIKKKRNPLKFLKSKSCVYESVINCITDNKNKDINILEIGCGYGYLTYALTKCGYKAKGIDISKSAINDAIKNFGEHYHNVDVQTYANSTTDKYDVIVATEVIEHIGDVISFLKNIKSLLNKTGQIILTTPNKSAFGADALWVTDAPPLHLWWFSDDAMLTISKIIGMDIKFYDVSQCINTPYYYYNKRIDLSKPIFDPIVPLNRITLKKSYKLVISAFRDIIIKSLKKLSKAIGIYSIIKCAAMVTLNRSSMTRSEKPYILCVQLFR